MNIQEELKKAEKYTSLGDKKSAEKIYISILQKDKKNSEALAKLGIIYLLSGYFKSAVYCLENSYIIKPTTLNTENLGLAYFCSGEQERAAEYFEKVIEETSNYDVFEKYIVYLQKQHYFKHAYEVATIAYKKFPVNPDIISLLADCCIDIGKCDEAYSLATKVLQAFPKHGQGWIVMGLLNEIYLYDEEKAKMCYKNALKCGNKREGYYNLAINAGRNGDYKQAMSYIKKIYHDPVKDSWLNFTVSNLYFKQRKFKKAYDYYVLKENQCDPDHPILKLKRQWDGGKYKDETLLVFCDQGYGDTFMFSRFIPALKNKFKLVKVLIRKEMFDVVKRSFEKYDWIEVCSLTKRFPSYDKSVILSHLPYYLKTKIQTIPSRDGYFIPDNKIIEKYNKIIKTDKLKVGICWEARGGGLRDMIHRTLTIQMFQNLFNIKGIQYYSFQVEHLLDDYKNYPDLIDLGKTFKNFDDTAGALANMDIIITVDTAIVHLAGALGLKTFLLLPYSADWRWFDNDKTTEWYNSVTIFKQNNAHNWNNVFLGLEEELKNSVNKFIDK